MSLPRPILANKYWLLTRRCLQRTFLMRPDEAMNNAFLYCLIEAALRFDIRLLLAQMMSNHHHVVLHDPGDHVVDFYHRFHTNLAKCINALRGRWENAFAAEPPCLVELVDAEAVLDKLVYTATNPVKDQCRSVSAIPSTTIRNFGSGHEGYPELVLRIRMRSWLTWPTVF